MDSLTISTARPNERAIALGLAFANVSDEERSRRVAHIQDLIVAGELDPEGIFVRRDKDMIRSVFVCVPMAGATALVWPPRGDINDDLIAHGLGWLRKRGGWSCLTALKPRQEGLNLQHSPPPLGGWCVYRGG